MKIVFIFWLVLSGVLSYAQNSVQINNGSAATVDVNRSGIAAQVIVNEQNNTYYEYDQSIFPFTMRIWRQGNVEGQNYHNNFDWNGFRNSIIGTTCYVDPVNGNNSNDGSSWLLAKKSVVNAITGTSANIIQLKPGWYPYSEGLQGTSITRDISLICEDGIATLTTAADQSAVVLTTDGTYPNTYSGIPAFTGRTNIAIDSSNLNEYGVPIRLTPVADAATVNSTPNSIYLDGTGRVYVRLFDDRAPDDNFYYFRGFGNLVSSTPSKVFVQNVNFYGASANPSYMNNATSSSTKMCVFVNCRFSYGNDNGSYNTNYVQSLFFNCGTFYNYEDGFDYIGQGSSGFEYYCIGSYNGYDNNANNGSTGHNLARVISVGCDYQYNMGKCVQDINEGTYRYCVGVSSGNSRGTVAADQYGFAVGSGTGTTTMWCLECTATGPQDGWKVFVNSILYWKGGNFASKTNLIQGTAIEL